MAHVVHKQEHKTFITISIMNRTAPRPRGVINFGKYPAAFSLENCGKNKYQPRTAATKIFELLNFVVN